jgi:rhodanese-related sulfurtransferase
VKIGAYQVRNLILNQTQFVYLDLRSEAERAAFAGDTALLSGTQAVSTAAVLATLQASGRPLEFPVVLLCETGEPSARLASELESAGYRNVFFVGGGAQALASDS